MDRVTLQGHIASALAKYDRPMEDTIKRLAELEVDKSESGEVGKLAYRKQKNDGTYVRVAVRVGKFVKQFFGEGLDDKAVQNIGADITALLWSMDDGDDDDDAGKVVELAGESLRNFYLQSVSGINSCMARKEAQNYLDIYVDNPDRVKLATVRLGDHAARALVWTFPDGSRYMDRIYHTSEACNAALKNYAARKGIGEREDIPSDRMPMKIRNGEDSWWPYMDTLCYMSIRSCSSCYLSADNGDYCLQTTDGYLEDRGRECYGCGCRVDDDYTYVGPDENDYCKDCYYTRFFYCDHCGYDRDLEDSVETANGLHICEQCYEQHFFTCEDCEHVYSDNDAVSVDGDRTICNHCFEDYYFECEECGECHHVDDRCDGPCGTPVCQYCYDNCFNRCSECDEVFDEDTLVDGMCSDCATAKMEAVATKEVAHE